MERNSSRVNDQAERLSWLSSLKVEITERIDQITGSVAALLVNLDYIACILRDRRMATLAVRCV
jgi:hypothetical protein